MNAETRLHTLTNSLHPARRAWFEAVSLALAELGVSMQVAFAVLLVSRLGAEVQQKILAAEAGVNASVVARALDQAEKAGLLARKDVRGDRRSKAVVLLPAGQNLARQAEAAIEDLREAVLGDLPPQDVEIAAEVLRSLEGRAQKWVRGARKAR